MGSGHARPFQLFDRAARNGKSIAESAGATMHELWTARRRRAKIEPFDATRQQAGCRYQSKLEFEANAEPICPAEFISRALNVMLLKNAGATSAQILPTLLNPIQAGTNDYGNSAALFTTR